MHILVWLLFGCGTEASDPAGQAPVVAAAPADDPAPIELAAEPELPEGYGVMTLLMSEGRLGQGVGKDSWVDLVSGEGAEEIVVAREVRVMDIQDDERGSRVSLALTDEHRQRLMGSQLPGEPRLVLHK